LAIQFFTIFIVVRANFPVKEKNLKIQEILKILHAYTFLQMLQSQQTLFFLFAILCSDSKIVSQSLQEDKIMAQITSDMLVGQIVNEYPMLIDTLLEAGMHCLGCPSSQMESLEDACMVHGLNPDALVLALNSKLGEVEA